MKQKEYPYDSVVIFKTPIILPSPESPDGDKVTVFGTMFNREREKERMTKGPWKHYESYPEMIDEYVVYLHVVSNFLEHGNRIENGCWCLKDGKYCYEENKTLLRVIGSVTDIDYQVIEGDEPIEICEGDMEEDWILSQTLIERVKIDLS